MVEEIWMNPTIPVIQVKYRSRRMKITSNNKYIKVVAADGYKIQYKEITFNEGTLPIDFDLTQIKEIKE